MAGCEPLILHPAVHDELGSKARPTTGEVPTARSPGASPAREATAAPGKG